MGCGGSKSAVTTTTTTTTTGPPAVATEGHGTDQGDASQKDPVESKDLHIKLRVRRQQLDGPPPGERDEVRDTVADKGGIPAADVDVELDAADPCVYNVVVRAELANDTKAGRHEKQELQGKGRRLQNACLSGDLFLANTNGMVIGVALDGEELPPENVAFTDALFTETVKDLWLEADKDGNGVLDAGEFLELMMNQSLGLGLDEQQIGAMIAQVDADHNGSISYEEFVPLANEIITRIFKNLAFSKSDSWCQLWSLKTGYYYFNRKTGQTTMQPPEDGFLEMGRRKTIIKKK